MSYFCHENPLSARRPAAQAEPGAGHGGRAEVSPIVCRLHLRTEYFKQLAAAMPGVSVKELMFRCGFTSRSSFYRLFAGQENMSPRNT